MRTLRELFQRLKHADGDARHALRQFNLQPWTSGKAASVKDLAETLGLSVFQSPLPKGMAGRILQDPFADAGFAIEVNQAHSVRSRRYTVLHELGHYFLHVDRGDFLADPMLLSRAEGEFYFDIQKEREANEFADVLLFGDNSLGAAAIRHGLDVARLANLFGVTQPIVRVALEKFGVT